MSALSADLVADEAGLAALEPDWWELWRRFPAATPFQSPAWLISWWRHFKPGKLMTVAVRQAGRLVGLAPFYLENGPLGRRLLPVGISLSDYLDVLVDPDAPAVGAALVGRMLEERDRWDIWGLEELAPGAAALELPAPHGFGDTREPQNACPLLSLAGAVDPLPEGVPSLKRRKLRMSRNRLSRRSGVALRQVSADSAPAFLETLFALHGARWQSRGETGVLADATVQAFQAEAIGGLMQAGLVRAFMLEIEGKVAGAYYGFHHREKAYAYLGGFDPAFAFESPGTLLVGHAIEVAAGEGAREFHFLRGQEAYKYEWGAQDRWNTRRTFARVADG